MILQKFHAFDALSPERQSKVFIQAAQRLEVELGAPATDAPDLHWPIFPPYDFPMAEAGGGQE